MANVQQQRDVKMVDIQQLDSNDSWQEEVLRVAREVQQACQRPTVSSGITPECTKLDDYGVAHGSIAVSDSTDASDANDCSAFAIVNATIVDAYRQLVDAWIVCADGKIVEVGTNTKRFEQLRSELRVEAITDAQGSLLVPGYIDLHCHGAWGSSFDDGEEGIAIARAYHMLHGTTRQVLSLITNPIDVMVTNIRAAVDEARKRTDILGMHLEGPFLALARKGAHDPQCLCDPTSERVEALLDASQGWLRHITLAPEREHGLEAVKQFVDAGVHVAVGHCDADYETAGQAFDHGADILTHMFDAMNGISHRAPGPIVAASERSNVTAEIINDGFHVHSSAVKVGFELVPHRVALITDAMSAAGCQDGLYKLGSLDVQVLDGHARLVSNGAIAGSTLTMQEAVARAVSVVGLSLQDAIEAATLTPARAIGVDKPNAITRYPLGKLAPHYAADLLMVDRQTLEVKQVWCEGKLMPTASL